MLIDTLLKELTEPRILSGGIQEPNNAMRKAAQVIKELAQLAQADKAGRLKAQADLEVAETHVVQLDLKLRSMDVASQVANAAYQEVCNVEYARNFT